MLLQLLLFTSMSLAVFSAPVNEQAQIISYEFEPNVGDGSYRFSYETDDGQQREETGVVKLDKENNEYIAVKGFYSYLSESGKVLVNYEADEDGYRQTIDESKFRQPEVQHFPAAALGSLIGGGLGK